MLWRDQAKALVESITIEVFLVTLLALEITALFSVPSVLLRRQGRPSSAIAWLLALFALPAIGSVAWWAIGRTHIERRLRRHSTRKRDLSEQFSAPISLRGEQFENFLPSRARGEYAFSSHGNELTLLADGHNAFPQMEKAIGDAQTCIHMLFYIFELDNTGRRICDSLRTRALAGVKIRVLLDGFGCQKTVRKIRHQLNVPGIEVAVFLPSRLSPLYAPRFNFINHRKILVVDNRIAFTGGMNIGNDYEHSWRDLMLRIQGSAVAGLNHVFLEDWYFATGQALRDPAIVEEDRALGTIDVAIVISGPDTESWIHDAYFMAISLAKESLWLATPYFIPTPAILTALRTAAGRGVEIRLILPSLSDVQLVMWASRSFYKSLIDAGVRIFEYSETMLHAKLLIQDSNLFSIGTANIDNRSFRLNFEVSSFVKDQATALELESWLGKILEDSVEITHEYLAHRSTLRKLTESTAHLLSPLL